MKKTIYSQFYSIAEKYPQMPAIIEDDRTLTFDQLSMLIDIIYNSFPKNIKRIGIVMDHRAEMIACIFAALKAGASYVPAEPAFPTKRICAMMTECGADLIFAEKEYLSRFDELNITQMCCETTCNKDNNISEFPECEGTDAAYILYTSGTTGRPKGICVTNNNVLHYVRAFTNEFNPAPGDIMLQNSVCTFDIFVEEVFCSLLNGAALAIPSNEIKNNLSGLMDFITRNNITIVSGFPYLMSDMNNMPKIPESIRLLISGGDVLRESYVNRLIDQTEVYNTYGPSETTVCASYYKCNNGSITPDGTYPIGQPVLGTNIRIFNDNGLEAKVLEPGEIYIYGDGVSNGYIGDHDKENLAFIKTQDGICYKTGDYGYTLPDGNIVFLHRKDTQIMVYGKRVELSEVESTLYHCHGVRQAVVTSFNDREGLPYIVAFVVPDTGIINAPSLREEMAESLASYMIPEYFVKLPSIKLTPNGKPDLQSLPMVLKN